MSDLIEQSGVLVERLVKFMKTREMNDPLFAQSMQLIAKLRKAKDRMTDLAQKLSNDRDNQSLRKEFDTAKFDLETCYDECDKFVNPRTSNPKPEASKYDKKLLIPKELTFVSLDVQGSEDLKIDEEPANVTRAFSEYYKLIEGIVKEYGVKKMGWAGDGFIAYFDKAENAVLSVLKLMCSMHIFNLTLNKLAKNFRIRIGVSTGEDYFDETLEIGKMTSKVIDLAGYLQKKAEITSGPKTFSRVLVNQTTLERVCKTHAYKRVLKLDKILLAADESKKVSAIDAFEILM
ncbi:MAG: adenylate/guanylate cyclase domain-containing protein [Candidatus Wallbacteria bacterium]